MEQQPSLKDPSALSGLPTAAPQNPHPDNGHSFSCELPMLEVVKQVKKKKL